MERKRFDQLTFVVVEETPRDLGEFMIEGSIYKVVRTTPLIGGGERVELENGLVFYLGVQGAIIPDFRNNMG